MWEPSTYISSDLYVPLLHTSTVTLLSSYLFYLNSMYDLTLFTSLVGTTSILYWHYPDYSWRRYLDIATVLISTSYLHMQVLMHSPSLSWSILYCSGMFTCVTIYSINHSLHHTYPSNELLTTCIHASVVHILTNVFVTMGHWMIAVHTKRYIDTDSFNIHILIICCIFQTILYQTGLLAVRYIYNDENVNITTKRKSWILSTMNAFIFSTVGLYRLYTLYIAIITDSLSVYSQEIYPLDNIVQIYFVSFCIMDIFIGRFLYPSYLQFLTGYIHHIFYITYFVHSYNTFASPFNIALLSVDIPTLLLGLGSLFPFMRNDILFTLFFVIFRIILHLLILVIASYTVHNTIYTLAGIMTLCVHVYWLSNNKTFIVCVNRIC